MYYTVENFNSERKKNLNDFLNCLLTNFTLRIKCYALKFCLVKKLTCQCRELNFKFNLNSAELNRAYKKLRTIMA